METFSIFYPGPCSGPPECAPRQLHLLPGHLDAHLHDLRLLLHPGVHRGDGSQQDGGQETGGDGE